VVGGGPAGLSAALMLARYGRATLTFHHNSPRNAYAAAIHGFLGHDGIPPMELLARGRSEVERYGGKIIERQVDEVARRGEELVVKAAGGEFRTQRILLATGIRDITPEIPGFLDFYGTSIHHCPDCDGYEIKDKRVAILADGARLDTLVQTLRVWTSDLIVLNDLTTIAAFEGNTKTRQIQRIRLKNGSHYECDSLFFSLGTVHTSVFHQSLGCDVDAETALIVVGPDQQTSVPGVYAAGDITPLSRMAIVAAAQGTIAAVHIHKSLLLR